GGGAARRGGSSRPGLTPGPMGPNVLGGSSDTPRVGGFGGGGWPPQPAGPPPAGGVARRYAVVPGEPGSLVGSHPELRSACRAADDARGPGPELSAGGPPAPAPRRGLAAGGAANQPLGRPLRAQRPHHPALRRHRLHRSRRVGGAGAPAP